MLEIFGGKAFEADYLNNQITKTRGKSEKGISLYISKEPI